MTGIYEDRLVAYVDILGWSEACRTESTRLLEAVEIIHAAAEFAGQHHKEYLLKTYPKENINPMLLEVQFGAFSDNFVVSKPVTFGARIFSVAEICRRLLKLGFLTRGGVSIGKLHHRDNVVFGPALEDAVALERQAVYPRLVCSASLIEHFEGEGMPAGMSPMVTDHLGRKIVNLFDPGATMERESILNLLSEDWALADIKRTIASETAKNEVAREHKLAEKWRYMGTAMDLMLERVK